MSAPIKSSHTKQWGLTPAISDALPGPADHKQNGEMIEELKRENNYEAPAETAKRQETLHLLQKVNQEFIREVSRRQRLPPSQIEQFGGKIYPYGSYRLGVFGPGSDIDTLAVAPRHVRREDFFEIFPDILRTIAAPDAVSSLTAVPDSFVPIIKLVLNDIEIDLIFVAIETRQVIPPRMSLNDNKLLDGLDQAGIRAITGPRVTDEILALVPEHKTFRTALRAIKLWAQRRAIYANIVGYPGGVAWAMLVARVCQLYPHAIGATIVNKFFFIIKDWPWPSPIMLKAIESGKEKVWNPSLYPGDRKNIMPIITPAYPSMCATYNISKSGKAIIMKELTRGSEITQKIFDGKLAWKDLFTKHTFFTQDHKYYLGVVTSARNEEAVKAWSGLVESKVRILVMQLELKADMIELARPFTKGTKRIHKCRSEAEVEEIKKGSTKYQVEGTTTVETTDPELVTTNGEGAAVPDAADVKPEASVDGQKTIYTVTFYVGIELTKQATKNLNIADAIAYFRSICTSWPSFKPELHELAIAPYKNYELPEDLFDAKAGDVKPTKQAKKKIPTKIPPKVSGRPGEADKPLVADEATEAGKTSEAGKLREPDKRGEADQPRVPEKPTESDKPEVSDKTKEPEMPSESDQPRITEKPRLSEKRSFSEMEEPETNGATKRQETVMPAETPTPA